MCSSRKTPCSSGVNRQANSDKCSDRVLLWLYQWQSNLSDQKTTTYLKPTQLRPLQSCHDQWQSNLSDQKTTTYLKPTQLRPLQSCHDQCDAINIKQACGSDITEAYCTSYDELIGGSRQP